MESACHNQDQFTFPTLLARCDGGAIYMGPNNLTTGFHTGIQIQLQFEQLISLFGYFIMFARTNFKKIDDGERFVQSMSG